MSNPCSNKFLRGRKSGFGRLAQPCHAQPSHFSGSRTVGAPSGHSATKNSVTYCFFSAVKMSLVTPARRTLTTCRPVSSCASRTAHSSDVCPNSRCPPGGLQSPSPWAWRRLPRRTCPSRTIRTPTPTRGRGDSSLFICTSLLRRHATRQMSAEERDDRRGPRNAHHHYRRAAQSVGEAAIDGAAHDTLVVRHPQDHAEQRHRDATLDDGGID